MEQAQQGQAMTLQDEMIGVANAKRRRHSCHWPGCPVEVPPKLWGCKLHWFLLPATLRVKIWRAYRPGQEITKTPSSAYLAIAKEVQAWIRAQYP